MKTALHQKLEKMCRILRKPPKHWILTGPATIRLPEIGEIVTTKRAIYAAFVGPIPAGKELRSNCEFKSCVSPFHQNLAEARSMGAREFSLPGQVEALKTYGVNEKESDTTPPKEMTFSIYNKIKFMFRNGVPTVKIHSTFKAIPPMVIAKIRNGTYDAYYADEWNKSAEKKKLDMILSNDKIDQSLYKEDIPSVALAKVVEPKDEPSVLLHQEKLITLGKSPGNTQYEIGFVACDDPYIRFTSEGWLTWDLEPPQLAKWLEANGYEGPVCGLNPIVEE